jgi:hypothetical protein
MADLPLRFEDRVEGPGIAFGARDLPGVEAPRRVRASFSAVVLLFTFTLGVGVAASYLAPGLTGEPSNPFASSGVPGTNNSTLLPIPQNITNPQNQTHGQNGTSLPSQHYPGNQTGSNNSTGKNTTGVGNGTGGPGGNSSTNQTGPGGNGTNRSSNQSEPKRPIAPHKVAVDRLPWFPWQPELLIGIAAFTSIGTLLAIVLLDSIRPPPPSALDPWRFELRPRRLSSPQDDPRRAVGEAARRLELALGSEGEVRASEELRARIFELYNALLAAVSPALGELRARTPREVEWLSVRYLHVRPETARTLTELFEEARYSSHVIRPESLPLARAALQHLFYDLRWFAEQ